MSVDPGKKSKGKSKSMNDDELMEQFAKENNTCSYTTCDKSVKLIRLNCQLCNGFFCTSHVLPEVHGCGKAARKLASASNGGVRKIVTESEKKQLEKKLSQKLGKMSNDRKKKSY